MKHEELEITASLAHIELKNDEVEHLGRAVNQMLEYFSKMMEVDVSDLEPTTHALLKHNRVRKDTVAEDNISDELLENSPDLEDRFIVIPNVL